MRTLAELCGNKLHEASQNNMLMYFTAMTVALKRQLAELLIVSNIITNNTTTKLAQSPRAPYNLFPKSISLKFSGLIKRRISLPKSQVNANNPLI